MKVLILFALCLTVTAALKDITLVGIYTLNAGRTGPPYDFNVPVSDLDDDAFLVDAMNKAMVEGVFSWAGTFHQTWGWYVTTLNGNLADGSQKQYWQILGGDNMEPIPLGVSSYVPADGETVLYRLVTWG